MGQEVENMTERIDRILEEMNIEKPKKTVDDQVDKLPEANVN